MSAMSASYLENNGNSPSEISGKPGQVWGSVVIPAGGKTVMRINGDLLQTSTRMNYGLENKDVMTRIQNIDSVEVTEGCIWWLLAIGIPALAFYFIGIIPIVLFFVIKQKWLVVYTGSANLILFHKNTQQAREFRDKLMLLARQLNSKTPAGGSSQKSMPPALNP